MEILKKELNQRFISKETLDSNEYQTKRKIGDIDRLLNQTRDELNHQKNMLQQESLNLNELKTWVFDVNTMAEDHGNQLLSIQVQLEMQKEATA
jgi:hypothetical protein